MKYKIPFNKPFIIDRELEYIREVVERGKISGNGYFTKKCHAFFEEKFGFGKCLLTSSCTDALEMSAILCNLKEGDEVIMPSYTFVSTANAFVLRGAKIKFADSCKEHPNMDPASVKELVTDKTKAIVVVHYAGVAVEMDAIQSICNEHDLFLIEDAAQAIDSYYKGKALGSIGDISAFSFHETKNVISGEGGMLVVNNPSLVARAEVIWEKGTNRAAFSRGEVNKYNWIDIGSSFLPSEITAAFLFAQLEHLEMIQERRLSIWQKYYEGLSPIKSKVELPFVPDFATNNAHLFSLICKSAEERIALIDHLAADKILAVFHYLSLHKSPFYSKLYEGGDLINCDKFADRLIRLPLFYELGANDQQKVIDSILEFYSKY